MGERTSSVRFAESYVNSYPSAVRFSTHYKDKSHLIATSTSAFSSSRGILIRSLLDGNLKKEKMTHSLMMEQIVRLSLQPLIQESGFKATLAPQSLESGEEEKGVDLIICDPKNLMYLGVDVKLRKGISIRNRDGYGWSDRLKSPYIYLSLGNWGVNLGEEEEVNVRDWLNRYTIPRIQKAASIPAFDELRAYLVGRIERSLNGYRERIAEPDIFQHDFGIPNSPNSQSILEEKLAVMHNLFVDLQMSL